ncbi:MAG: hypothetical protein A2Z16_05875 [Chloroflexi bacterium RBG_16_54_18]|nr:MAG: hypothetical protein A2Z16_05875 [Chloroflexi bacterium RBG_16_54_18]
MNRQLSDRHLRLLRCMANQLQPTGQLLPDNPRQAVESVFAVQAQELPSALLSLRARSRDLTASGIEQVRQEGHSLVWTWSLRGTLHLLAAEDARWLLPLLAPGLIASHQARFRQLGWDEGNSRQGLKLLAAALQEYSVLTRLEVAALLQAKRLPYAGQATVHLLYRAALEGLLCIGELRGSKPTYVSFASWTGGLQPVPLDEALSRLALRYLAAYAPARPADLASWSGLKPAQAQRAWEMVGDRLSQVEYEGQVGWMLKSQSGRLDQSIPAEPTVRLLPRFDTFLLGYASRDFMVSPQNAKRINAGGGIIHPVLLVDGRASGTWNMQRKAEHLKISLYPFDKLPAAILPLIEREAGDLKRFLGLDEHAQLEIAW